MSPARSPTARSSPPLPLLLPLHPARLFHRRAVELLRLIPNVQLTVIERCSGHGGAWGVKKGNFKTALKIGKPAVRQALKLGSTFVVSECPLAGEHIRQGMEGAAGESHIVKQVNHPIELLAQSYGFEKG